jgi:hypothetical protein
LDCSTSFLKQEIHCATAMHETLRVFACQLINEAGICLKASQVVGATAQVFFHRYFQFITKEFRPERVVVP